MPTTNDPILDNPHFRSLLNEILIPVGLLVVLIVGCYIASQ